MDDEERSDPPAVSRPLSYAIAASALAGPARRLVVSDVGVSLSRDRRAPLPDCERLYQASRSILTVASSVPRARTTKALRRRFRLVRVS